MPRSVTTSSLVSQRNALVALARHLQQQSGGVLMSSIQMLVKAMRAAGGLAYRAAEGQLSMVADHNVPPKAKPWIAQLPICEEDWFVAQRVARTRCALIDRSIAGEMHSIGPAFEEEGWRVLAAAPVSAGRTVYGVIAIAGSNRNQFDDETLRFLSAAGAMLGLAIDRAELAERARDERHEAKKRAELATLGLIGANAAQDLAAPLRAMDDAVEQQAAIIAQLRVQMEGSSEFVMTTINALDVALDQIAGELRIAHGINSRQLSLSRESSAEPLNLVEVAHNAAHLASGTFSAAGVALSLEAHDDELWVNGRHESLSLMLVQLLMHAADSCTPGPDGTSEVVVRVLSDETRHIVSIETTGNPELRNSQSLFQTMTTRAGSIIDVGAIKQTVLAHKGHIELDQSELGGVRFDVVLPQARTPEKPVSGVSEIVPQSQQGVGSAPASSRDNIVIIDDNDALVRVVRRQLQDYHLKSASSVAEGIELLQQLRPAPRLVICDINLPDGTGIDIHRAVDFQLGSRFVFITSGLLEREVSDYIQASSCPVFSKPLAVDEMRSLLVEDDLANHPSIMSTLSPDPTPPPYHLSDTDRRQIRRRLAKTRNEGRDKSEK